MADTLLEGSGEAFGRLKDVGADGSREMRGSFGGNVDVWNFDGHIMAICLMNAWQTVIFILVFAYYFATVEDAEIKLYRSPLLRCQSLILLQCF